MPTYPVDSGLDFPNRDGTQSSASNSAAGPSSDPNPVTEPGTRAKKRKDPLSKRDTTALERLADDLTLSVPLVLLFCIYLIVSQCCAPSL